MRHTGCLVDCGSRMDLLVDERAGLEVRAVGRPRPIREAQVLTPLKLSGQHLGLILNFNTKALKDGITFMAL